MFKPDFIGNNELSWFVQSDFRRAQTAWTSTLPTINSSDLEPLSLTGRGGWLQYVLDPGESATFSQFWAVMTSANWPEYLRAAARRLIRAQGRRGFERDEDRLVDLVIGFEALVLKKNEHRKQHKMATRFSNLIGGGQRTQIEADLNLAYDLRNDAVHDGYFDPNHIARIPRYPTPVPTFIMHIEQYLRKGMKNYVTLNNNGQSKNQIIATL